MRMVTFHLLRKYVTNDKDNPSWQSVLVSYLDARSVKRVCPCVCLNIQRFVFITYHFSPWFEPCSVTSAAYKSYLLCCVICMLKMQSHYPSSQQVSDYRPMDKCWSERSQTVGPFAEMWRNIIYETGWVPIRLINSPIPKHCASSFLWECYILLNVKSWASVNSWFHLNSK